MEVNAGILTVAKKKPGDRKTIAVKIEAPLARKANAVAQDQGVPLSTYLSDLLRASIERDWGKVVRRLEQEDD